MTKKSNKKGASKAQKELVKGVGETIWIDKDSVSDGLRRSKRNIKDVEDAESVDQKRLSPERSLSRKDTHEPKFDHLEFSWNSVEPTIPETSPDELLNNSSTEDSTFVTRPQSARLWWSHIQHIRWHILWRFSSSSTSYWCCSKSCWHIGRWNLWWIRLCDWCRVCCFNDDRSRVSSYWYTQRCIGHGG